MEKSNLNNKKIAKLVLNIVFYVVAAIVMIVAVIGMIGKFTGRTIPLFGYSAFVVVSPSMATVTDKYADFLAEDKRLDVKDLIITKKVKNEGELQLHTIVTFEALDNKTIVHRIVEIKEDSDGQRIYVTRGDANLQADGEFTANEFSGIVVANLGQFGKVIAFLGSVYGLSCLGAIGFLYFLTLYILNKMQEKEALQQAYLEPDDLPADSTAAADQTDAIVESEKEAAGDTEAEAPDNAPDNSEGDA